MDPDYPCLSATKGIPAGLSYWTTMGEYSQASVLSEHWPGNSAIRCRSGTTMECSIGCEVAKCGSLALCLHNGPRFGPCTFSLDGDALIRLITLSLYTGLSTPGSALLPYGFGRCGQVSLLWLY